MKDKFYTVSELAKELGVSRQTVHNWIKAERFPNSFTVGGAGSEIVLIPAFDVEPARKEEAEKLLEKLNRLGFQTDPA